MSGVAFIDTETTGLDPDRCPIWEIAVILPDGPGEGEHCWQVALPYLPVVGDEDPSGPYLSRWVLENTGWNERYDSETALDPEEAIAKFASLVDGRHLVGAVPSFDEERLRRLYRWHIDPWATRFPWHYHLIDVEAMAVGWLLGDPEGDHRLDLPWKSDDLSRALGVEPPAPEERHTALADARWARAMYERMTR